MERVAQSNDDTFQERPLHTPFCPQVLPRTEKRPGERKRLATCLVEEPTAHPASCPLSSAHTQNKQSIFKATPDMVPVRPPTLAGQKHMDTANSPQCPAPWRMYSSCRVPSCAPAAPKVLGCLPFSLEHGFTLFISTSLGTGAMA